MEEAVVGDVVDDDYLVEGVPLDRAAAGLQLDAVEVGLRSVGERRVFAGRETDRPPVVDLKIHAPTLDPAAQGNDRRDHGFGGVHPVKVPTESGIATYPAGRFATRNQTPQTL